MDGERDGRRSDEPDSSKRRLRVVDCDLDQLALALEDSSWETTWWFDPTTGEVEPGAESLNPVLRR